MVTPTVSVLSTREAARRYSRACPPYAVYSEQRYPYPLHQNRTSNMTEREPDDSSQTRKRIAVACGRCRKRKIRCSGDPGNGEKCSNCKNAGYEPCLFLRVSSTETPLRDGVADFGYSVDAARTYHSRAAVSPHNPVPHYTAADMSTSDMMTYRQNTYPYNNSKNYYSTVSGWAADTYGEDDYGLTYSSYPPMSQDPIQVVPGYRYSSSTKAPAAYVDTENTAYQYGNLVHRPAASHDLPTLSLSGMAASLSTPDRIPTINRTLPSTSNYRSDGLPGHYSGNKSSTSQSSDVGYNGLSPSFGPPVTYGSATTIPSSLSTRSSHSEVGGYQSTSNATADELYGGENPSYRTVHESDSYIYSDRLDSARRESYPGGGVSSGSVLSNGQVYVPETHSHSSPHGYSSASTAVSTPATQSSGVEGARSAVGTGGPSTALHVQAAGSSRSTDNLRGA